MSIQPLGEILDLFHSPQKESYAVMEVHGHRETWALGIEELRALVNIGSDDDWRLLVAFLVGTFRPWGPYPILALYGPQGASKSSLTKMVRALIDPNEAPIRTFPRTERDLFISAQRGWI